MTTIIPKNSRTDFRAAKLGLFFCLLVLALPLGVKNAFASLEKLVVGTMMEVRNLTLDDPALSTLRHLTSHQSLVRLAESGEITGELAESWQTMHDKTWSFTLRQGLLWHDGRPVTAKDVQYTLKTLPRHLPIYRSHFGMIEKVSVKDARTVVLELREPHPRLLVNLLVLRVFPAHIFEKAADPRDISGPLAAVGSGPFVFDFFDPAAGTLGFRAFSDYWRGPPYVKRLVFRFFKNMDTMILALRKGEIDLIYQYASGLDPFQARNLQKNPDIRLAFQDNLGVPAALFFNVRQPPLNSRQFRQALALAVNYSEIVSLFAGEFGLVPHKGFVPSGHREFVPTDPMAYDPHQARLLLDSMGMVDEDGDGYREKDGQTIEFELIFRGDVPGDARLAQLLGEYFRAIGIRVKCRAVDATVFRTISERDRTHTAMLARTTPWGMMMWAGCGSGYFDDRYLGWSALRDPTFTAIVDRMNHTSDPDTYRQAAKELQGYYAQEFPAIALYWNQLIQAYRAHIEGWRLNPMYGILGEESWYAIRKVSPN